MVLSRFALRARIYVGFSLPVLLGLGLTMFGGWQLLWVEDSVRRMSALSDNMTRVLEISGALATIHRTAVGYMATGNDGQLANASAAAAKAIALLRAAAKVTLSDDRRRAYNDLETSLGDFQRKRDALMQSTQAIHAGRSKLFSGGDQLTGATAKLVEAARGGGDSALSRGAIEIETAVLLVRVANWRFLATHDASGPATFKINAGKALAAIAALEQLELPNAIHPMLAAAKVALADYIVNFEFVSAQIFQRDEFFDQQMVPLLVDMQTTAARAQSSLSRDVAQIKAASEDSIENTMSLQWLAAGSAVVIGGLMAFLIARVIIGPVAAMTQAMQRLATGDIRVEVPSRERPDEIGAMARAVEVVKQNAVE
jgi:HAMP domain-containing protein